MEPTTERKRLAMACVLAAMQHPHGLGVPGEFLLREHVEILPEEGSGQPLGVRLGGSVLPIGGNDAIGEQNGPMEFEAIVHFGPGPEELPWVPNHIHLTVGPHCAVVGDCNVFTHPGNCNLMIAVHT